MGWFVCGLYWIWVVVNLGCCKDGGLWSWGLWSQEVLRRAVVHPVEFGCGALSGTGRHRTPWQELEVPSNWLGLSLASTSILEGTSSSCQGVRCRPVPDNAPHPNSTGWTTALLNTSWLHSPQLHNPPSLQHPRFTTTQIQFKSYKSPHLHNPPSLQPPKLLTEWCSPTNQMVHAS
jgi:hypothetical protein